MRQKLTKIVFAAFMAALLFVGNTMASPRTYPHFSSGSSGAITNINGPLAIGGNFTPSATSLHVSGTTYLGPTAVSVSQSSAIGSSFGGNPGGTFMLRNASVFNFSNATSSQVAIGLLGNAGIANSINLGGLSYCATYDGTYTPTCHRGIWGRTNGAWSSTNRGLDLNFYTAPNGATAASQTMNLYGTGMLELPYNGVSATGIVSATGFTTGGGTTGTVSASLYSGIGGVLRIGPYNGANLNFFSNAVEFGSVIRGGANSYGAEIKSSVSSMNSPTYTFRDAVFMGMGGLMDSTSGTLTLITSNTARVYVKDNGYVGIGTQSPIYPFHVSGTIYTESPLIVSNGQVIENRFGNGQTVCKFSNNSGHGQMQCYQSNGTANASLGGNEDNFINAGGVGFWINNQALFVKNYGTSALVGIGFSNALVAPSETLHVSGTFRVNALSGSGNGFACLDSNGKFYRSATACN